MKTCQHCGTEQKEDAKFCSHCGAAMDEAQPVGAELTAALDEANQSAQAEAASVASPPNPAAGQNLFPTKLLSALAAAAVLLIFVAAALSYSGINRGGGSGFFQAFDATMAQIEAEFDQAAQETGLGSLWKELEEKGFSLELSLEEAWDESIDPTGIHILLQQTAKRDQFYVAAAMTLSGIEYLIYECSYEDQFFALSVPLLFSGAYGVHLDELGSRFAESDLGNLIGADQQSVDEMADYIDSLLALQASDLSLSQATQKALNQAFRTFEQTMQITEGVPQPVQVNGVSQFCDVYEIHIEAQALEAYLITCVNALLDDPIVYDYLELLSTFAVYSDGESLNQQMKDECAEIIHYICEDIAEIRLLGFIQDGLTLRLQISVVTDYQDSVQFVLEFGGADHLTDAMTFTLHDGYTETYENMYQFENMYQIAHRGSIVPVNGVIESRILVKEHYAYQDEPEDVLSCSFYWDSKAAENNVKWEIEDPYYEEQFTLEGTLLVDDGLFFNPGYLSYADWYEVIRMPFTLQLTPLEDIKSLSSLAVDIFSMDMEDINAFVWEVNESINNLPFLY